MPPAAAPQAPPPPLPPPDPFNTAEFRQNPGLGEINALPAYKAGLSGQGVTVAVIDSGVDPNHTDLDDNLSPASTWVANPNNPTALVSESTHGTQVAGIIAAERNGVGIHGVAFNATILSLRTDEPGSCASKDGCAFTSVDIAAAINLAVDNGVRVINISLGATQDKGSVMPTFPVIADFMRAALQRAADAGVLVVFAAGNNFSNNPNPTALAAYDPQFRGNFLIVGATDRNLTIFNRSDRGGIAKDIFVVAPSQVVSTVKGGGIFGTSNGTSFAAPHVSGAAALLFEMFPNLAGRDIVQILTMTAKDLGAPGVDGVYGHGIIDLGAAIQPIGTVAVATAAGGAPVPLQQSMLLPGSPFGDSLGQVSALDEVVVLDSFRRSYKGDLNSRIGGVAGGSLYLSERLIAARTQQTIGLFNGGGARLGLSFYDREATADAVIAALDSASQSTIRRYRKPRLSLVAELSEKTTLRLAYGLGPLDGGGRFGTVTSEGALISPGLRRNPYLGFSGTSTSIDLVHQIPAIGEVSFGVSEIDYSRHLARGAGPDRLSGRGTAIMAGFGRRLLGVDIGLGIGALSERGAVLGSLSSGALRLGSGAGTAFGKVTASLPLGRRFAFSVRLMQGMTRVSGTSGTLVRHIGTIRTSGYAAMLEGRGLFSPTDRLSIAVSQPLRTEGGRLSLSLPTARDYRADRLLFSDVDSSLSPTGREIDFEVGYQGHFAGFDLGANLVRRRNPGHVAASAPDNAVMVQLGRPF